MAHRIVVGSLLAIVFAIPLAACASKSEGGAGAGTPEETTAAAASDLSMEQNTFAPGAVTPHIGNDAPPGSDLTSVPCHPELFARTVEYAEALNYHLHLFLERIDDLLQTKPMVMGSTSTWTYGDAAFGLQLVLDETSPGVFGVTLGMASTGSPDFTPVVTGIVDRSNPGDITKQLTFDLDARHRVFPYLMGDQSSGQLAVSIERWKNADGTDRKRVVTYDLAAFVPVFGDPHGPRTGSVDLLDEPGVGGAMLYEASTVFLCPSNPQALASDATTYARWVVQGATVSGRADAIATGGQVLPGDRWVGLSCRTNSLLDLSAAALVTDDAYWLVKEEDASGATLVGLDLAVEDVVTSDAPCSPAFGAVTDQNDDRNDPTLPSSLPSTAFPGQF
jgi:hypothetical protein